MTMKICAKSALAYLFDHNIRPLFSGKCFPKINELVQDQSNKGRETWPARCPKSCNFAWQIPASSQKDLNWLKENLAVSQYTNQI